MTTGVRRAHEKRGRWRLRMHVHTMDMGMGIDVVLLDGRKTVGYFLTVDCGILKSNTTLRSQIHYQSLALRM